MFTVKLRMSARTTKIALALAALLANAGPLCAQSKATLSGSVRSDSAGQPLSNAEVSIPSLRMKARTDSSGRFRIDDIKPGDYDVLIRRLGFAPLRLAMTFLPDETTAQQFELSPSGYQLEKIRVRAADTARSLYVDNIGGFERRRRSGFGSFIGAEELQAARERQMTTVLETITNLRLYRQRTGPVIAGSEESGRKCYAQVFYDGVKVDGPFDVNSLTPATLRGIEYYPSKTSAPAEFTPSPGFCGVLVFWTYVRHD
jgi:Predicted outer membrane protein